MKIPKSDIPNAQNERKKRLAEALRKNLQLRKARVRVGEAPKDGKVGDKDDSLAAKTK